VCLHSWRFLPYFQITHRHSSNLCGEVARASKEENEWGCWKGEISEINDGMHIYQNNERRTTYGETFKQLTLDYNIK
jgi:hypothetical protein